MGELALFFLQRAASDVEVVKIFAWRHEFERFHDQKLFTVEGDGFPGLGIGIQVDDGAGVIMIDHDDTDFIGCHGLPLSITEEALAQFER
jgi:hypothetical protein